MKRTQGASLRAVQAPRSRELWARLPALSASLALKESVCFQAILSGRLGGAHRHLEEDWGKKDFLFYFFFSLKKKKNQQQINN